MYVQVGLRDSRINFKTLVLLPHLILWVPMLGQIYSICQYSGIYWTNHPFRLSRVPWYCMYQNPLSPTPEWLGFRWEASLIDHNRNLVPWSLSPSMLQVSRNNQRCDLFNSAAINCYLRVCHLSSKEEYVLANGQITVILRVVYMCIHPCLLSLFLFFFALAKLMLLHALKYVQYMYPCCTSP